MKIYLEATGGFVYPDASALCGPVEAYDEHQDVITNPSLIVEALSPSTEAYDRGEKFEHYKTVPSLQAYLQLDDLYENVEFPPPSAPIQTS